MVIATVCLAAVLAACPDRNPAAPRPRGEPRAQVARGPLVFTQTATIECRRVSDDAFTCADFRAASASRGRPGAPRAKPAVVIPPGTTPSYFAMNGSNYQWSGDTLSIDRQVVNWLGQSMGTLNDTAATGLKVFEWEPPVTTVGSGQVTLLPGDGSEAFRTDTTGTQTYFAYSGILPARDTSAARTWRYVVPHTVQVFHSTVGISAEIPAEGNVTLTQPDSVPSWVYADSSIGGPTSNFGSRFVKHVLFIEFNDDATLADRQLAVALVGGAVVGGRRFGGGSLGYYIVRVPDDGSGMQLFSAGRVLEKLPIVRSAMMKTSLAPQWIMPNDGSGWRDWRKTPDSADTSQQNWALEMIDAPMAWGCSSGDPSLKIGQIDHGFRRPADLVDNLPTSSYVFSDTDTIYHATSVGSILAARGNNDTGMTGVVWRASLRVEDPSLDSVATSGIQQISFVDAEQIGHKIVRLARGGVRVINISLGVEYYDSVVVGGRYYKQYRAPRADSIDSTTARNAVRSALNGIRYERGTSAPSMPLLVIGAGNFAHPGANANTDAWWSGLPQLRDSLGDSALIVGASGPNRAPAFFTGANVSHSYVQIMAPGHRVFVLDDLGVVRRDSGTSFAAPHVTGVAGLVLSFDPGFTGGPPELKQLILAGADSNKGPDGQPRRAGGYRFLNAYETLKQAAHRKGAPLCGNRVWAANSRIIADRGGVPDTLMSTAISTSVAPVGYLSIQHGGRRLDFVQLDSFGIAFGAMAWTAGAGWQSTTADADTSVRDGGATQSASGTSHNGDSVATVEITTSAPGTQTVTVRLNTVPVPNPPSVATGPAGPSGCFDRETESGFCYDTLTLPATAMIRSARLAFPQNGGDPILALNRDSAIVEIYSDTFPDDLGVLHTLTSAVYRWRPVRTDVYTVALASGTMTLRKTITDSAVFGIALAEAGDEVAATIGRDSTVTDYGWRGQDARNVIACRAEFRPIPYGQPGGWGNATKTIADVALCPDLFTNDLTIFGGTFSPVIATAGPGAPAPASAYARARAAVAAGAARRMAAPARSVSGTRRHQ